MFISFNFMAFTRFNFILFNCSRLSISMNKRKKADLRADQAVTLNDLAWEQQHSGQLCSTHPSPPTCARLPVAYSLPLYLRVPCHSHRCTQVFWSLEIIADSCSCVSIKWIDPPIWVSKDNKGRYGWVIKHMLYILGIPNMNFLFPIKRTWEVIDWW